MNTYPITHEEKDQELKTTQEILRNSYWHQQIICPKQKHTLSTSNSQGVKKTFTYYGPDTEQSKLFKNTDIKIAFKTTNTTKNDLNPREKTVGTYNQSGVYQFRCNECPLKYAGQMRCTFKVQYKEHIQAIRTNTTKNMPNTYSPQDTHIVQLFRH
jgi:hypothetical protein